MAAVIAVKLHLGVILTKLQKIDRDQTIQKVLQDS